MQLGMINIGLNYSNVKPDFPEESTTWQGIPVY